MYCQKILASDPARQHAFAFVTDLVSCWLLKVDASIVDDIPLMKLGQGTLQLAKFPWYSEPDKELLGLKVLITLGKMDRDRLGLSPLLSEVERPVKLRSLGSGSTAYVYGCQFPDEKAPEAVLKVIKRSTNAEVMDKQLQLITAEKLALTALNAMLPGPELTEEQLQEALKHIPWLQAQDSLLMSSLEEYLLMGPLARRLGPYSIEVVHVYQLFSSLWCVHVRGWLHGDISYHNLMLAPRGWRSAKLADTAPKGLLGGGNPDGVSKCLDLLSLSQPHQVALTLELLIIDWGYATGPGDSPGFQGIPITMSQNMLAKLMLVRLDQSEVDPSDADTLLRVKLSGVLKPSFKYSIADELESAAKSLLMILSPSLKRSIKQHVALEQTRRTHSDVAITTYEALWECWQGLLVGKDDLLQLCRAHDYDGLARWFTNRERLLFWQREGADDRPVAASAL